MIRTAIRTASNSNRSIRSLALNVHFKHPDLGMKDYEILSRASAFLLSVDPIDPVDNEDQSSPFGHLQKSQEQRDKLIHKESYSPDPAGGPKRDVQDLSWLEFCPGKHRPLVHLVTASHVLAPWKWKNYYPHPWLDIVNQEHVRYSIDVFDNNTDGSASDSSTKTEPLATFALNPYPIHHPSEDIDLAIIHLKQEETTLNHLKSLGVEVLHLRHLDTLFEQGDAVLFDGYELAEEHYEYMEKMQKNMEEKESKAQSEDDDTRVFMPYEETGNLIFASINRFLAETSKPLPEGLCGGPVIDTDGRVCGMIEGIVPPSHEDKNIAGAASFIPSFRVGEFIEYAEKDMLEKILPKHVFDKVVDLKDGKSLHEKPVNLGLDENGDGKEVDAIYNNVLDSIKESSTPEQIDAILGTLETEQDEVLDMITREGGDLDEIILKVRTRAIQRQRDIVEGKSQLQEAEIISERQETDENPKKQ